jgi:hypothetical protein
MQLTILDAVDHPCSFSGGSPLLQQGELDFSPAKKRRPRKWALALGFPANSHIQPPKRRSLGSHDDAFLVVGLCSRASDLGAPHTFRLAFVYPICYRNR